MRCPYCQEEHWPRYGTAHYYCSNCKKSHTYQEGMEEEEVPTNRFLANAIEIYNEQNLLVQPKRVLSKLLTDIEDNKSYRKFVYKVYEDGKYEDNFDSSVLFEIYLAAQKNNEQIMESFLESSALKGNAEASTLLAEKHILEGDHLEAAEHAMRAYEKGEKGALNLLVALINKGYLNGEDIASYCKDGYISSSNAIADKFVSGEIIGFDFSDSINIYKIGMSQGSEYSAKRLLSLFSVGNYVPESDHEKFSYCIKLAEEGNSLFQYTIGKIYEEGTLGQPKDYKKAFSFYKLSAENCNQEGKASLAKMYEKGRGCPANRVLAYAWYNVAASIGSGPASDYRDRLEKNMSALLVEKAQEKTNEILNRLSCIKK